MTAPATTGQIHWADTFLLGHEEMDDVHHEFVTLLGQLQGAPQAELAARLDALAVHTRTHFEMENKWMLETDFPPRDCHIDEHAAVLKSIDEVRARVALDDYADVASLAAALADWFPGHADYLDSALAQWMCKRRFGGKPVVVRRGLDLS
ncbi:bacteriohemerythrin [Massilia cavernae]|uniref:Hemerythrin n=1 Tax=Massilia cavernae TaxID=2320864 RepID=A0A418Y0L8_9BURK|nr:hemerythrin domain-containing protein [Massilia cavernae]RJG18829.1 hemerythrin [Massilia cavernae]